MLHEFAAPVTCYTLSEDGTTWSEPVERTHQWRVYEATPCFQKWNIESTTNISLQGRINDHWTIDFVLPGAQDIAFLTMDKSSGFNRIFYNVIPGGDISKLRSTPIGKNSEFSKWM